MDEAYHYPPELMNLLIEAIPRVSKYKKDVVLFFRGAGVPDSILSDLDQIVRNNPETTNKFEIARTVLRRLNEKGDTTLRPRREILKRITHMDDFSACWPNDRLEAQGLVSRIREVVNVKDSFTRMSVEREAEAQERRKRQAAELAKKQEKLEAIRQVRGDLYSQFSNKDPVSRGKALEGILNRLFAAYSILVREAFTVSLDGTARVWEQIDGAIEYAGHLYLVEMKWRNETIGREQLAPHLVNVYNRGGARGLFISNSTFSDAAKSDAQLALTQTVVVLCELQEIVALLEREAEISDLLQPKIRSAELDRIPLFKPFSIN